MSLNWPPEGGVLSPWICNGRARLDVVVCGARRWPVTLGDADQGPEATWLASLVSALIGAPKDEARQAHDIAGRLLHRALDIAEHLARRAGADRAAIVNNTLLSVSPIGAAQLPPLAVALTAAAARWPDRIVVARGILAERETVKAHAALAGGIAVPSRVSYTFDLTTGTLPDKINARRDRALLEKSTFERIRHEDFSAADLDAAHAQYADVYLARHHSRNPHYTRQFLADVHHARGAEFFGLKSGGELQAFVALRDHGDFLSVPLIGYVTDADRQAGLYRKIFALALEVARDRRAVINFGAGAGRYKSLRGAQAVTEWIIVVPTRVTVLGRIIHGLLKVSERPLDRIVPKAIAHFGG